MDTVVAKLTDLVGDTCLNLLGVPKDIMFFKNELRDMNVMLMTLDDMEQLDPQVQNWRNQVLEVAYDIEDCIDDFKDSLTSINAKDSFFSKFSNFFMTLRSRFDTAEQIKVLKTRMQEISERRKRLKLDESSSTSSTTIIETLDPRLPALYNETDNLVGIDNPRQELIKWVLGDDKKLKVVSIVGTGGLGKTTLANEVYREVGGQFNCKAFVSVSRTPEMTGILTGMLSQLKQNRHHQHLEQDPIITTACDVQSILHNLIQFVHDKRYLIIIDDLWNVPHWNTIRCVFFPQNNQQSRVIVTTRNADVARACCCDKNQYIHYMKPLSHTNSRKLFLRRIYVSEDGSDYKSSEAVLCEILKKCGGLPLAIVTIASILAYQQPGRLKEKWESIQNSLAAQSEGNNSLQDMMHILDLSYKSLPKHLKPCFLYLGKYPEDHIIHRDDLVRQWVAEGFVMSSPGRDVWDIAEGYFNGLVNRNMIQPLYGYFNTMNFCRVHDMMLDLILKRCREDNFFTVVRAPQEVKVQYKVRRLSMNIPLSGTQDVITTIATTIPLSQVRSLAMFGGPGWMPHLLELKFIRVLFIEFHKWVERIDLTCIIQLSQLRYLKIKHMLGETKRQETLLETNIELPSQIQRLKHLETLELIFESSQDFCLPPDIVDLPYLSHLTVPSETILPQGIGKLKQLHMLEGFSLQKSSSENIKALGALTNLVDLTLCSSEVGNLESVQAITCALRFALEKLCHLKKIFIYGCIDCRGDGLNSLSPPFRNLEELHMHCVPLSRVPRWIGDLRDLRSLVLQVDEISNCSREEEVGIIGTLPSLIILWLRIPGVPAERIVITGFPALKSFTFDCNGISRLSFEAGAMPNLRKLQLRLDPREWDKAAPAGLEHLPNLKEITAKKAVPRDILDKRDRMAPDVLIRGVFQEAVDALPTRPAFTFEEDDWRARTRLHREHVGPARAASPRNAATS